LQMEVANLEHTHLVQQYINMEGAPIKIHDIPRDRGWFHRSAPILKRFVEDLEEYFPFDLVLINYQMQKYEKIRSGNTFDMQRVKESIWRFEDECGENVSGIFKITTWD